MLFTLYYVSHVPRTWLDDFIPWYRRKLKAIQEWYYIEFQAGDIFPKDDEPDPYPGNSYYKYISTPTGGFPALREDNA